MHQLVDELGDIEAEAALVRLQREHDALRRLADQPETNATLDALALRNAREAIREDRGTSRHHLLARTLRRRPPPAIILTRDEAPPTAPQRLVALVTRTIRGIDSEVQLGPADGMPTECAISLDDLRTVPKALLTEPITQLDPTRVDELCQALARSTGCA